MQRLFHVASGANEAVELDPAELARVRGDGWVWLDLAAFGDDEVEAVGEAFRLDRFAVEEVLGHSRYPKVEVYDSYTFVVGHGLSGGRRLRTVEYDAFIGADFLVTFQREDLPSFVWGREHIVMEGAIGDAGPDRFFSRISNAGVARLPPILEALDERILALEDRAIDGHPEVPVQVQALRRDVIVLREAAAPQREVFRILEREVMPAIGERARLRFGTVFDSYTRATEEVDSARQLLSGVLDTYRSAVAEKANEVMKVLTVFAAIVLPLSLLAGIYGMNFINMPELDWRWGYFGLLGIMGFVGLSLWVYFARRGFIGGPSLRSIPRGVGHGLSGIAQLTVVPTLRIFGIGIREGDED